MIYKRVRIDKLSLIGRIRASYYMKPMFNIKLRYDTNICLVNLIFEFVFCNQEVFSFLKLLGKDYLICDLRLPS
jgi:hypothetical protein